MPATDFGWSLNDKPPIFQVYGTKRKSEQATDDTTHVQSTSKRPCPETADHEEMDAGDSMMTDDPQAPSVVAQPSLQLETGATMNNISTPTPTAHQAPIMWSTFPDTVIPDVVPTPQLPAANENNNTVIQTPTFPNTYGQDDMIMDLNGETFSNISVDLDGAVTMEGEGAPDPSQYSLQNYNQHIVNRDSSPTTGRVRCFCKPSWDAMLDTRPYISDYY